MEKITLISSTNRLDSKTKQTALYYQKILKDKGIEVNFLLLEDLPYPFHIDKPYGSPTDEFKALQDKYLISAKKLLFIIPEYNGSFPGILKYFIDSSDVVACFHNKKVCLVGVAAGRGGNIRGIDHFTGILNHLGVTVMPKRLPISKIGDELDDNGNFKLTNTIKAINKQIDEFILF